MRQQLFDEIMKEFKEWGLEEEVKELIMKKMVCFGPNPTAGSNILVIQQLQSEPFFSQFLKGEQQNNT